MLKQIILVNILLVIYVLIFSLLSFANINNSAIIFIKFIWFHKESILIFPYISFLFCIIHMTILAMKKNIDIIKFFQLILNAFIMCAVCYMIFFVVFAALSNG